MARHLSRLLSNGVVIVQVSRANTYMLADGVRYEVKNRKVRLKISRLVSPTRIAHRLLTSVDDDLRERFNFRRPLRKRRGCILHFFEVSDNTAPPTLLLSVTGAKLSALEQFVQCNDSTNLAVDKSGMTIFETMVFDCNRITYDYNTPDDAN